MGRLFGYEGVLLNGVGQVPRLSGHRRARDYMREHKSEYKDPQTDEFDLTRLAEGTCHVLGLYEGDEIPEWMFDMAYEVCDATV